MHFSIHFGSFASCCFIPLLKPQIITSTTISRYYKEKVHKDIAINCSYAMQTCFCIVGNIFIVWEEYSFPVFFVYYMFLIQLNSKDGSKF